MGIGMTNHPQPMHISTLALMAFAFVATATGEDIYHRSLQLREQEACYEIDPDTNYFCPVNRYCAWMRNNVPNRNVFKNDLEYTRREWDYLGRVNAPIEYTSFADLAKNQQDVLAFIGFDSDSHDCCHGHYTSHAWSDFSDAKYARVKAAWELLGYDETSWVSIDLQSIIAPYGGVSWDSLPEDVKSALSNDLCYNMELWDGVHMSLWTNSTILPGALPKSLTSIVNSTAPSSLPSVSIIDTEAPTKTPTASPTAATTFDPTPNSSSSPSSEPSNEPSQPPSFVASTDSPTETPTPDPTKSPTSSPTPDPTPEQSSKPTIHLSQPPSFLVSTDPPTVAKTNDPTPDPTNDPRIEVSTIKAFDLVEQPPCKELNPDGLYFCPAQRYCEWDYYDVSTTDLLASVLNYTEESWNYDNDINMLEYTRYGELADEQRQLLETLGYDEQVHDCCHSHFNTFEWAELATSEYSVVLSALRLLGYDEQSWSNREKAEKSPEFENTPWDDLPLRARISARSLCYSRETWDRAALPWPEGAIIPGSNERETIARPPSSTGGGFSWPNFSGN